MKKTLFRKYLGKNPARPNGGYQIFVSSSSNNCTGPFGRASAEAVSKAFKTLGNALRRPQNNPKEESPSTTNNGGCTSYYDLPPESERPCLDDLIEFKDMSRWRAEIFKSMYGWEGRATRSEDGSSSEERELNKCHYYLERKRAMLGLDLPTKYALNRVAGRIITALEARITHLESAAKHLESTKPSYLPLSSLPPLPPLPQPTSPPSNTTTSDHPS